MSGSPNFLLSVYHCVEINKYIYIERERYIYIYQDGVLDETVTDMNKCMKAYNECVNKIYCVYLQYKLLFM